VEPDISTMIIKLVEVQTGSESLRVGMGERAFQRSKDLRAIRKRWDESGPHAAAWTKELRDLSDAGQETVAKAVALVREVSALRVERNLKLVASASDLGQSLDQDPRTLLSEMIAAYRRELEVDLPPIEALMSELDRQVSDIEALADTRLSSEGRASKWFVRKSNLDSGL
jgi:hypothetical protein